MERLSTNTRPAGISSSALRTWGIFFLAIGIAGRGMLQTHYLGINTLSARQLLEVMQNSQTAMILATASLVMQAMETCAAPIFGFLLVEGVQRTSSFRQYFLRVLGVAVLSEIPYNMAIGGRFLDLGSRNPVFAMALAMVMLYFYRRYAQMSLQNVLIKVIVTVASVLWTGMLGIDFGAPMIVIICVLWTFRKKPLYRNFAGAAAGVVCTLFSPFFVASPMGFLAVHVYNGEHGEQNRLVNYLAYPAILLAVGAACMFLG